MDTITVIDDTPDKLIAVHGIGKKRVEKIKQSWEQQKKIICTFKLKSRFRTLFTGLGKDSEL